MEQLDGADHGALAVVMHQAGNSATAWPKAQLRWHTQWESANSGLSRARFPASKEVGEPQAIPPSKITQEGSK